MMDEAGQRRTHILTIILGSSVAMLALLDATVFYYSSREGIADREISFGAFSILPAFFIFLFILSRRGFSRMASYLAVIAYLLSDSYAAYRWGVTMQVVLIAYALIIVIAAILCGSGFGLVATGFIAAYIIPLGYAQYYGLIPTQSQRPRAADDIVYAILFGFIMTVAWLYNREIERSEAALMKERDLLEVRVAERTEELRRIQLERVEQLNRLAELGQLSSGLFHDLLNLLNALSLRSGTQKDADLVDAFDTARQIEGFMRAVQRQISSVDQKERFSLFEAVEHALRLVNYKANKGNIRILFNDAHKTDIEHVGTPFKFQEIVINLLMNAIEACECIPKDDARRKTIVVSLEENGDMATLRVEDNGCGMTPEVSSRIFEPFFSTKGATNGIGIGLATIKKIVEHDFKGTISAESIEGRGSIFTVIFPVSYEAISDRHHERDQAHSGAAAS